MTAHGAVLHLTDAFYLIMGEHPRVGDDSHLPTPGAFMRMVSRIYALTSPLPWPKGGVPTSAAVDQEKNGTPPGDFEKDVACLKEAMASFRERNAQTMPPHIYFGDLSQAEWGRWGYRHMDHHLRQFGT
jgi:hypothetical protein